MTGPLVALGMNLAVTTAVSAVPPPVTALAKTVIAAAGTGLNHLLVVAAKALTTVLVLTHRPWSDPTIRAACRGWTTPPTDHRMIATGSASHPIPVMIAAA